MARAIEQDNATGAVSYWQAADNQSLADRNGVSLADYIHALYGFLRQIGAKDVLMIGGGGGTLATMLSRSGVAVTMLARGVPVGGELDWLDDGTIAQAMRARRPA